MRLIFISLCFCMFAFVLKAQKNYYSLGLIGQSGYVFPTNNFLSGAINGKKIDNINAASLRFIYYTNGTKDWHQLYGYPSYGFGLYYGSFNEVAKIGNPLALYAFINSKILKKGNFMISGDYALGISYFAHPWDLGNLDNIAIGSHLDAYIQAGVNFEYLFENNMKVYAGLSLIHFSNGATRKPNMGINCITPQIGINYNFFENPNLNLAKAPSYKGRYVLISRVYGGWQNIFVQRRNTQSRLNYYHNNAAILGIAETFLKKFNKKHSLGIGIDLVYKDNSNAIFRIENNKLLYQRASFSDRLNLSAYISYEYRIHNVFLNVDCGYYIIKNTPKDDLMTQEIPDFYQRIGVKYTPIDNWFVSINLRSMNFSKAHFIEWGLGHRIAFGS